MREDANAEEDAALGAYRDRLLVELAQNAADAAVEAGVPGRLLLRLDGDRLLAANTGAALTADGVAALATLRASAKRDPDGGSTGRFGVGFAAVLAVTDEPAIRSDSGAVRFSRKDSGELVRSRGSAVAVAELDRRGGHVPTLRLPFPAPDAARVPTGYDTVVDLPLRDAEARAAVERALHDLTGSAADVLLLALPALAEIVVEVDGTRVRRSDVTDRWTVVRRSGRHTAADLAGRGVEDRDRAAWHLAWALPRTSGVTSPGVVCAPTPTDEDLPWPALLVATFPLGPDRRRLAPGRATEVLLDAAASAYGELLAAVAADGGDALALVPYGAAAGRVDAELRGRVLDVARDVPLLVCVETVDGAPIPVRPSSAVALTGAGADDPSLLTALAPAVAGLVAAPRGTDRLLTDLGVTRMGLAEVLDVLPAQDAARTDVLFTALAPLAAADPVAREAMSGLPVRLLDGRVVRGPRGLLLLDEPLDPEPAGVLADAGLRLVHANGPARDLLVRLGAREGGMWAVLTDPALRAAVAASPDAEDPDVLADAVLEVVAGAPDADRIARELPWLADLALPDEDDELAPAGSLVLPDSLAARSMDPDDVGPVSPDLLRQWGSEVLRAVGVLSGPALVEFAELDLADLEPAVEAGLAGVEEYVEDVWADVLDEPSSVVHDVVGVRDLDLVVAHWPEFLAELARTPQGSTALTAPWVVGRHRRQGLLAWWLRRHGPLQGLHRGPDGPTWLPAAPAWTAGFPPEVQSALGVLPELAAADVADLPALLAAPDLPPVLDLLRVWTLLAGAEARPVDLAEFAALDADGTVVRASDPVVVDDPRWAQRTDLGPRIVVPQHAAERVADLLDLDLASDRADGSLEHPPGRDVPVPEAVRMLLPAVPATWTRVGTLRCDGVPVRFWGSPDQLLATDDGAADALAWAAGAWWARGLVHELLTARDPGAVVAAELPGLVP